MLKVYDASMSEVASYTYDAWGKVLSATGSMADINPIRYRSYYFDSDTGLYYLQSRYYDPEIGRFINADCYASTGQGILGCNMYAYCLNNPVKREDQSGKSAKDLGYSDGGAYVLNHVYPTYIKYNVPQYVQYGNLCWAYSQVMIICSHFTTPLTQGEANRVAITIAKLYHRSDDPSVWNQGGWPTNRGCALNPESSEMLYSYLVDNGPLYAYYNDENVKGDAHMIVVIGVDLLRGTVYTINPWGYAGEQSFSEFMEGYVTSNANIKTPLASLYVARFVD